MEEQEKQAERTGSVQSSHANTSLATKRIALGFGVGVGLLAVVGLIAVTIGLYRYDWEGRTATVVSKALPYPAATVNGVSVRLSDYLEDVATLERFFAQQVALGGDSSAAPTSQELREVVMDRLVRGVLLDELAAEHGVAVTDEELAAEFALFVESYDSEAAALAEVADLYGWDKNAFTDKVLYPVILERKLGVALREDSVFIADATATLEGLLVELDAGADFSELAREYSDDQGSAFLGGELGAFGRGYMVPEFEEAAFSLAPGERSGVVGTQFGLHIIQVDDVKTEGEEVVEVTARHILIMPPPLEELLDAKLAIADVDTYIDIAGE